MVQEDMFNDSETPHKTSEAILLHSKERFGGWETRNTWYSPAWAVHTASTEKYSDVGATLLFTHIAKVLTVHSGITYYCSSEKHKTINPAINFTDY